MIRIFYWLLLVHFMGVANASASTIAVINGRVTQDHRSLLWVNQDGISPNIAIAFFIGKVGDFIGITTSGDTNQVWAGINSVGLAIVHCPALDLDGDAAGAEGFFVKKTLSECGSIAEFEAMLNQTNPPPGRAIKACFGLMDASGHTAIFEAGNNSFIKFDAGDPDIASAGFLVRSNFGITGRGIANGAARYHRARQLISSAAANDAVNYQFLLQSLARDLVSPILNPYPLPYSGQYRNLPQGFIDTNECLNRSETMYCAVIQGVLEQENPKLTTFWCIPGQPAFGLAVPLWVNAGPLPDVLNNPQGSKMNLKIQKQVKRAYSMEDRPTMLNTRILAGDRFAIWPDYLQKESLLFQETEKTVHHWRSAGFDPETLRRYEYRITEKIYQMLR